MAENDSRRSRIGDFSWRDLILPAMLQTRNRRSSSQEDTSSDNESFLRRRTRTSSDVLSGLSAPPPSIQRPTQTWEDWSLSSPLEIHRIPSIGSESQSGSGSGSSNIDLLRDRALDLESDEGQPSRNVDLSQDMSPGLGNRSQLEGSSNLRFSFSDGDDTLFAYGDFVPDI